jgi:hypothetical protein
MKRRKCAGCQLLEPHDAPWDGDYCIICASRMATTQSPPKRRTGRKDGFNAARKAKHEQAKARYVPGYCRGCKQTKPVTEFSPRTRREPVFYLHHSHCKECVNAQAKQSLQAKRGDSYEDWIAQRSTRSLAAELKKLRAQTEIVTRELDNRGRLLKRSVA